MTRLLRLFVAAVSCCALPACGPSIKLAASPGETPGHDANPFNPTGPPTLGSVIMNSQITLQSENKFSGPVTLSAECCQDVIRNRWVSLDPTLHFTPSFSTNPVSVPAGGSALATMGIVVQSSSFPLPIGATTLSAGPVRYGKYLLKVVAKDSGGTVLEWRNVGVKVLPQFEPGLGCSSGVEVLGPLSVIVDAQVASGEATPRKATTPIAVYRKLDTPPGSTVWTVEITDDPARPPDTAAVVLKNRSTSKRKAEIRSCSTTSNFVRADWGLDSVTMLLDQAKDRTLIFQQEVCTTFLCFTKVWDDIAVLAEPAFWSVFGGKKVTITWHGE